MLFLLISVVTCQTVAALSVLDLLPGSSASEDDVLSNIEFIPKVWTLNPSLDNPFSNIPKKDLSSFLSHIHHRGEKTEPTSENINDMKTPKLNHKHKLSKFQYLKQDVHSTCSKYMNYVDDTASTDAGAIELINYLCEYLGAASDSRETKDEKYIIATLKSSDEAKSPRTDLRTGREVPHTSRPSAARPDATRTSYRPINGRRDWMVLNEEYPGMMKQYINQFGVGQQGRRERHWGGWDVKIPF